MKIGKKGHVVLPLMVSLIMSSPVLAMEEGSANAEVKAGLRAETKADVGAIRSGIHTDVKAVRQDAIEKAKEIRTETSDAVKDIRAGVKAEVKTMREGLPAMDAASKEAALKARADFKISVEAKREAAKAQIEVKRAEMKEKLKVVRDEKKKAAVERIDKGIADLNARRVEHFTEMLGKLDGVVLKISERAAATTTVDMTSVQTAISAAKASIEAARAAVSAQASKVYAISITTEANLRADVGVTHKQFRADLEVVQDKMKDAHAAVRAAADVYIKIGGVKGE